MKSVAYVGIYSGSKEAPSGRNIIPVSYTHLDVYKRQVQHRGREIALQLVVLAPKFLDGRNNMAAVKIRDVEGFHSVDNGRWTVDSDFVNCKMLVAGKGTSALKTTHALGALFA